MNKKDVAQIKRRLNPEKSGITCIRGYYVNGQGEAVAQFCRSLVEMGKEEAEKYLAIFRRTLSGVEGQNLLDMDFSPEQVMESEEHGLLMRLRADALRDDADAEAFFRRVIAALPPEEHYLILLMHDGMDIPYRGSDENSAEDMGSEVFHYILCSVCPVKLNKPALTYDAGVNDFRSKEADWIVGPPEMGFAFPAYEERAANIYHALYYTRDTADPHEDFVSAVFGREPLMPAAMQKEAFQAVLSDALREDCSYEVMQAVHDQVMERMEEQKENKQAEMPRITKYDVKDVLEECGVAQEKVAAFEEKYDAQFGSQAALSAVNVSSPKQFEVRTPSVVIKVNSARSDLVETRLIDGHAYILIRADEGVEVNGVNVSI